MTQTVRKFSHSSLACYRRCRMRFFWQYVEGYQQPQSVGQARGSAGHAALAKWYELKNTHSIEYSTQEAVKAASATFAEFEANVGKTYQEDYDLLELILRRYFDLSYKIDKFEVLELEKNFEVMVGDYPIIGYIDAIVKVGGNIWLMEHKFNKIVETKHIDLDSQMGIYMLAAMKLGYHPRGVLYNVVRVAEGGIAEKEPFKRIMVYRNPEGLKVLEKELIMQCEEANTYMAEGGNAYRNDTKDCSWDCGFYNVCLSLNDNGDAESVLRLFPKQDIQEGDKYSE